MVLPTRREQRSMRVEFKWQRALMLAGAWLLGTMAMIPHAARAVAPADLVYRDGYVYTVDAKDSVQQALAVLNGRIVYVGNDAGIDPYVGQRTQVVDLHGRMVMPGLVDGHMHPMNGGSSLLKCNLNYERLTIAQMQARIQTCLDKTRDREPDGWLEVVNWFQEAMLPAGTVTTQAVLDALKTNRPIFVRSSFGHTGLINSRAIQAAGIGKGTQDPPHGHIGRDSAGIPTGILDDAAQRLVDHLIPPALPEDNARAVKAALDAARKQGITSFMDAKATEATLAAFATVELQGGLTARAHFAVLVEPAEGADPQKVVARLMRLRQQYDQGRVAVRPAMTVRNMKLFLDGVISAPALSGAMLEPYWLPSNTAPNAAWQPSKNRGPAVYFAAAPLKALLVAVSRAGFEAHMHADGDRAVREGLDAVAAVRGELPGRDIRIGIAHDEIVDPADFPRFKQLKVIPVLSFQWQKRAPDTVDNLEKYLGPNRYKLVEPAAFLADAGARIAYGSDWPVDPLDEWLALKVGITRTDMPTAAADYLERLGEDRGLTRRQVLRAITINSSYELHQDADTGSLETGKLADFIVLDRNVMQVAVDLIAETKVVETVVGGRVVYSAEEDAAAPPRQVLATRVGL
jgi:predicted amidohydrolase YtcJ